MTRHKVHCAEVFGVLLVHPQESLFSLFRRAASLTALNSITALIAVTLFIALPATAESKSATARYMGVGSCSSSNCHGNASPKNSADVLQNEYITWQKRDKHSQAYAVLTNGDSKIIGKHLGIAAPEKDPLCLSCHATYVKDAAQGAKYTIEDGVSCESCHGAAEKWLSTHAADGSTHNKNIVNGLNDIVDPLNRAALCTSCHLGDQDKAVTHRLIGAGHPRLTFELDTFGMIQPKHWEVDDDYKKRKGNYEPVRAWLLGQVQNVRASATAIETRSKGPNGVFPELTLFYCYSCHHSLTEDQWKSYDYKGKPGELRVNVASLALLEHALPPISKSAAEKIGQARLVLEHFGPADQISAPLAEVEKAIRGLEITPAHARALLKSVLKYGAGNQFHYYESAEQVAMATSAILSYLSPDGTLFRSELNRVYQSLGTEEAFTPQPFAAACQALLKAMD